MSNLVHGSTPSLTAFRHASGVTDLDAYMRFIALLAAGCLMVSGCSGGDGSGRPGPDLSSGSGSGVAIPQPHVPSGVPVAPDSERVDLTAPGFSHPTVVDNPLFPVSLQRAIVFVGHVDGTPFRTEVTLLPFTRVIDWAGQRIETLVSQYTAYLGGRIQEVAYDLYSQADDGSVWYFGEDVADLEDGAIATKEGTWLTGKDGPVQMIMPGDPQVGDVYRTENIPGIAFEQVTVKFRGQQLTGPLGPVSGMVGEELHEDGTTELKHTTRSASSRRRPWSATSRARREPPPLTDGPPRLISECGRGKGPPGPSRSGR
jgi:hypothetical protein